MSYPIGRQESYDSLRPYLPEGAKAILEKEIPRIRKQIDGEIDDFVKQLSQYIKQQVEAASKEVEEESKLSSKRLDTILIELRKDGLDTSKLSSAATELQKEIENYRTKWQKLGETVQRAALTAAKAAGVPIPVA